MGEPCTGMLVVDDDDDIRDTIVESFKDEGYGISGARNGQVALEMLRAATQLPCVILLDIMMPVMDGPAFRKAQLLDARLAAIPIVVVTANANLREVEEAMHTSGALRKPVSFAQLLAIVERYCGTPDGPAWSA